MDKSTCTPCGGEVAVATNAKNRVVFRPRIEILSQPEGELLRVELPGITRERLDVQVEGDQLVVRGSVANEPEGRSYLLREYGSGDFERRFKIGEDLDTANISAELAEGVLALRLPKKSEAKPRKIEIRSC
ncbi:MAG: Hsp20/alpha crystallin family protein [Planctomycetes bacterium]|nr:Hsp20/alpha crystallin family protein [Planctomycetota bacterium]